MGFSIRLAAPPDVPAMHRVRMGVRENRLSRPGRISEPDYLPYVEARTAWVAETRAGIRGFAVLDAPAGSLWALFVAPDAEGQGMGRALHRQLVETAGRLHIAELRLDTAEGTRAEGFYRNAGWQSAGLTAGGELNFRLEVPRRVANFPDAEHCRRDG